MKGETVTPERHRRVLEQRRQAVALAHYAEGERDRMFAWACQCLDAERTLRDRCTYLYGLAASLGATPEQLAGPDAP